MKKTMASGSATALAVLLIPCSTLAADGEAELKPIQVRGEQDASFVERATNLPRTESRVGQHGIANLSRAGQSSLFQILDMVPSVSVEPLDAYGIARTGPGGGNMRIRGQNSSNLSLSIEGIPLAPPPRFGPREAAFDAENFAAVSLMKGASPVQFGNGWGSSAGSANVQLREAAATRQFQLKQGIGEDGFRRTFLRVDSGAWSNGIRTALSYSNASAGKWRGIGEAPGKRENLFLDLSQRFDNGALARVFVNHYDYSGNLYRSLNYAQALDLERYRNYDYNPTLAGNAASDVNYFGYNRIAERFSLFGGVFELPLGQGVLRLKPYVSHELIHNWDGMASVNGSPGIRDWLSDKTIHGAIGEYAWKLAAGEVAVGFWAENLDWPEKAGKVFRPNVSNGLTYAGWETLHKYDGEFTSRSPYARFEMTAAQWRLTGGIKHVEWKQPATLNYYLDATLPNAEHNQILTSGARADSESSVGARSDSAWLPNIGASYAYSETLSLYANVGRNYNSNFFGGGEMARAFSSSRAAFRAAGITAEMLRQRERMELADSLDVGARWQAGSLSLAPTLFYTNHKNKAARVVDPLANLVYKQAAAKAHAQGLEIEATWQAARTMQVFASLTWNRSSFDADIPLASGTRVAAADKQFPDTPKLMGKLGTSLSWDKFEVVPMLKWIGPRYGDVTNMQRIPGYAVADANFRYSVGMTALGQMDVCLSVVNLFDKRYIASISASDDGTTNQASYYPGAPRTLAVTMELKF